MNCQIRCSTQVYKYLVLGLAYGPQECADARPRRLPPPPPAPDSASSRCRRRAAIHPHAAPNFWGQYANPSTWYWYTCVLQCAIPEGAVT